MSDPTPLAVLLLVAAGTGVTHTLLGPDHYLPFVAAGKAGDWSARRVAGVAAIVGCAHCLVSVVIVATLLLCFTAAIPVWLDGMTKLAAWTMIAAGVVSAIGAWRRRRNLPAKTTGKALTLLALAFLLGPCEWLIPIALTAAETHGLAGALIVSAVYTLCTVATMVTTALALTRGLRRLPNHIWLAPVTCLLCGTLVLTGI